MDATLGLDIGRNCLVAIACTTDGQIRHRARYKMVRYTSPRRCLRLLARAVTDAVDTVSDLQAVGIGFPGLVNHSTGIVRRSQRLAGWENIRLGAAMIRLTGLPTRIDTRVNNAARAERMLCAAANPSFLYVSGGSRIRCGLVLGGHVWSGAAGLAGEIAHAAAGSVDIECECGRFGCAAVMGGSAGIARQLDIGIEGLARCMQQRPDVCRAALTDAGSLLGDSLASGLNLLNLETVILGGHLATYRAWRSAVELATRNAAVDETQAGCTFEPARAGADARAIGAALLGAEDPTGFARPQPAAA